MPEPSIPTNELASIIHQWARGKGFYDREEYPLPQRWWEKLLGRPRKVITNPSMPAEKLALIHEEVSEVLEALRSGDFENEGEECADIIIRVLDFCAWRGHDIEILVLDKVEANMNRPHLHGKKF